MRTIPELRALAGGLDNLTDEEIAQAVYPKYQKYYPTFDEFYKDVKSPDSAWKKQFESGVRNYAAGFGELGAAVGLPTEDWAAEQNQKAAQASLRARQLGIPQTWEEAKGVSGVGKLIGKYALESSPYLAEAIAGGVAGRAALTPAMAARGIRAAQAVGPITEAARAAEVARAATNAGRIGLVAGTYPSSVGDILSSQRDETGTIDRTSAFVGGVPYAALNLIGLEGLVAGTRGLRPTIKAIEEVPGLRGRVLRGLVSGAVQAPGEAFNEFGQEVVNQAGRIAVNPAATFTDEAALARYKESAIAGALLGKTIGGVAGTLSSQKLELMPGAAPPIAPATTTQGAQPAVTPAPTLPPMPEGAVLPSEAAAVPAAAPVAPVVPAAPAASVVDKVQERADARMAIFAKYGEPQEDVEDGQLVGYRFDGKTMTQDQLVRHADDLVKREAKKSEAQRTVENALQAASNEVNGKPLTSAQVTRQYATVAAADTVNAAAIKVKRALQNEVDKGSKADQARVEILHEWHNQLTGRKTELNQLVTLPKVEAKSIKTYVKPTPEAVTVAPVVTEQATTPTEPQDVVRTLIADVVNTKNKERDVGIILDMLGGDKSSVEVAKVHGVSDSRVRQLVSIVSGADFRNKLVSAAQQRGVNLQQVLAEFMATRAREQAAAEAEGPGQAIAPEEAETRTTAQLADEAADKQAAKEATQEQALDQREIEKTEGGTETMRPVKSAGASASPTGKMTLGQLWEEAAAKGAVNTAEQLTKLIDQAQQQGRPDSVNPGTYKAWKARIASEAKEKANAVSKQGANEEVLRSERPEVGLQEVGKGNAQPEGAPAEGAEKTVKRKVKRVVKAAETQQAEPQAPEEKPAPPPAQYNEDVLAKVWDDFRANYAPDAIAWENLPDEGRQRWFAVAATGPSLKQMTTIAQDYSKPVDVNVLADEPVVSMSDTASEQELDEYLLKVYKTDINEQIDVLIDNDPSKGGINSALWKLHGVGLDAYIARLDMMTIVSPAMAKLLNLYPAANATVRLYNDGRMTMFINNSNFGSGGPLRGERIIVHEIGHVVDAVSIGQGFGTYSSGQMFSFEPDGTGRVGFFVTRATELLLGDPAAWHKYIGYPLTQYFAGTMNERQSRSELFAQLFALAVTKPELLQAEFPEALSYMNKVIEHAATYDSTPETPTEILARSKDFRDKYDIVGLEGSFMGGTAFDGTNLRGDTGATTSNEASAQDLSESSGGGGQGGGGDIPGATAPINPQRRDLINRTVAKLPEVLRDPATVLATNIANWAKKGLFASAFTHDLVSLVQDTLPAAKEYYRIGSEWGVAKRELEVPVQDVLRLANRLNSEQIRQVNAFVRDSRLNEAWGYVPAWKPGVAVNPELARQWATFTADQKDIVDRMFKHGEDTLARMQSAVRMSVTKEYEEQIAKAKEAKADSLVASLTAERNDVLKEAADQWKKIKGPYAPMKRHGDYVVVAKSQAFVDATPSQQEKMKSSAQDYFVAFFPSLGQARVAAQKLEPHYANVVYSEKETSATNLGVPKWSMLQRLREAALLDVEETIDDPAAKAELVKAKKAVYKAVSDLYLSMLSETSARQSMRPLRKVAGFDEDMLRSFATHGAATAHYVSALEKSRDMQDAIQAMRQQAKQSDPADRPGRIRVLNELIKRYAAGIEFYPMDWQNKALQFNSTWMLLTSPAYYLQNTTQPFMMTLPILSGDYGPARSWGNLLASYGDVRRLLQQTKAKDLALLNLDAIGKADEARMLKALKDDNILDIGIERELGQADYGQSGVGRAWQVGARALNSAVRGVEIINRVSSALASYRLAKEEALRNGRSPEHAEAAGIMYAKNVVRQTHGDYSDFNAPRIMRQGAIRGLPIRLIMQFRKYQAIQISLTARILAKMLGGATPEEKRVGFAQFRWLMAHHVVMAGALGAPVLSTMMNIMASMFGEPPDDEETTLRKAIGDRDLANLLLRGAPAMAGVNLSQRLGMGQMLSLLPYTNANPLDGRRGYADYLMSALGPFIGGLGPRMADGISMLGRGEIYKGAELMMPSGLTQAMRAYRQATEGVTTRAGDVVIQPEDYSMLDSAFQALGMPSTTTSERSRIFMAVRNTEQYFNQEAQKIRLDYAKTRNLASVADAWNTLQDERAAAGLSRQPLSTLVRAGLAQGKRERQTIEGVPYNKQNQELVRRLTQM